MFIFETVNLEVKKNAKKKKKKMTVFLLYRQMTSYLCQRNFVKISYVFKYKILQSSQRNPSSRRKVSSVYTVFVTC